MKSDELRIASSLPKDTPASPRTPRLWLALLAGAAIGTLGGLIGLGGAEFRLPLLIALFSFVALEAVIVNKAVSLVVVVGALAFRTMVLPPATLFEHWPIVANLLLGSIAGQHIASMKEARRRLQQWLKERERAEAKAAARRPALRVVKDDDPSAG